MSLRERVKAAAKNIEGKLQEAVGNVTGDRRAQAEGKAKQFEGKARHAKEDFKDRIKRGISSL